MPLASGDTSPLLSFPFFLSPFFLPFSFPHFFSSFFFPSFFPSRPSLYPHLRHGTFSPTPPSFSIFFSLSTQTHYTTPPIAPVTVDQWATPPPTANDHLPIPSSLISSLVSSLFHFYFVLFSQHTTSDNLPSSPKNVCKFIYVFFFFDFNNNC